MCLKLDARRASVLNMSEELRVRGEEGVEDLDGDGLTHDDVLGAVDYAHAAVADALDDAVLAGEHGPGLEVGAGERRAVFGAGVAAGAVDRPGT